MWKQNSKIENIRKQNPLEIPFFRGSKFQNQTIIIHYDSKLKSRKLLQNPYVLKNQNCNAKMTPP